MRPLPLSRGAEVEWFSLSDERFGEDGATEGAAGKLDERAIGVSEGRWLMRAIAR
jgi:hypothetical protein